MTKLYVLEESDMATAEPLAMALSMRANFDTFVYFTRGKCHMST